MDSKNREQIKQLLEEYILDTFRDIETLRKFCDREPQWTLHMKSKVEMMRDIRHLADKISLNFDYVKSAENKTKAVGEYLWSGMTHVTADSRRKKLEKRLGSVLKETLEKLEELQHFLDAVERLAVTSQFVFMSENVLPRGVSAADVQSLISTTRVFSPQILHFKRDARAFFMPSLFNVEVLDFHLVKYIETTQQLCEEMKKSNGVFFSRGNLDWENLKPSMETILNMSAESVCNLYDRIKHLTNIRKDESFRMTFLFGGEALRFIGLFSQCGTRMHQFLCDLEGAAVQLDKMKLGSSISTVASSSVGITGGVLSIAGLALAPVTAGVSLALVLTGVGLGVTSGVTSLVTGITKIAVNTHHGKNANKIFNRFIEDVEKLLVCMEQVANSEVPVVNHQEINTAIRAVKCAAKTGTVAKGIDALVDGVSAVNVLRSEEVVKTAVNLGLQEAKTARGIPNFAADLPGIGQLAKGTPLAMTKSARAGVIGVSAVFIAIDAFFLYRESKSLSKGKKNKTSRLIRSRSALWLSEVESWEKIYKCLCKGIWTFRKSLKTLEQPFHA